MDDLCIMQVHAHPDDEASKGAGVASRYAAEGVRTVLVTCTGGEAGEILNPAMDLPEVRENLFAQRMKELEDSVAILKYSRSHLLGYLDSGMPESEANADPRNFWNAPMEESVGKLVAIVRSEKPSVLIAYGDEHGGYPHPDHIRAHEIAVAAFDAAADAALYPDAGGPWQISKLYYCGWTMRQIRTLHATLLERGLESRYEKWVEEGEDRDHRFTTRIDVGAHLDRRRDALLAHRTQIAPDSAWFSIPVEDLQEIWPWEEYILARTRVDTGVPPGETETDLLAGLR